MCGCILNPVNVYMVNIFRKSGCFAKNTAEGVNVEKGIEKAVFRCVFLVQ